MKKIQYIREYGLFIPKLESRPMGANLPLMDYATGKALPKEEQIMEVTDKEAEALIRAGNFIEITEMTIEVPVKKKQVIKKEVELNGQ